MYSQLQELYTKLADRGFVVLGFPCNQFGKQEPGSNEQIKTFIKTEFGITFPVFDKVDVNGANAHPLFLFLRSKLTGVLGTSVKWNFTKFLCNRRGEPVKRYAPPTKPLTFEEDIVQLLNETQ